ncbi:MAG: hypothetical protein P8K10_04620 [Crocinitomicaceae bacterium]|nr:hypothetical protein [Crocinitomicaceae bacterium]
MFDIIETIHDEITKNKNNKDKQQRPRILTVELVLIYLLIAAFFFKLFTHERYPIIFAQIFICV